MGERSHVKPVSPRCNFSAGSPQIRLLRLRLAARIGLEKRLQEDGGKGIMELLRVIVGVFEKDFLLARPGLTELAGTRPT